MKWNQRLVRFDFDDAPAKSRARGLGQSRRVLGIARLPLRDRGDDRVIGRRGNWAGNLFSFDVERLVCDLDLRRESERAWSVRLLLEGAFQVLTEWNIGELMLEPMMFRRALLGLPAPPDLGRYREATRRASVASSLSLTLLGRRLPEFWRQLFRQLAAPFESAHGRARPRLNAGTD